MKCPVCTDVTLVISSREGIEIDHCPDCRGVWLDRGELDKVIERAAPAVAGVGGPAPASPPQGGRWEDERRGPRYSDDRRYEDDRRYPRRKRRSFLDDIFDFD